MHINIATCNFINIHLNSQSQIKNIFDCHNTLKSCKRVQITNYFRQLLINENGLNPHPIIIENKNVQKNIVDHKC